MMSVCTTNANDKSINTVWFVHTWEEFHFSENVTDDYGYTVSADKKYILGQLLEQVPDQITRKKIKWVR